jgi:hypothetical protein
MALARAGGRSLTFENWPRRKTAVNSCPVAASNPSAKIGCTDGIMSDYVTLWRVVAWKKEIPRAIVASIGFGRNTTGESR